MLVIIFIIKNNSLHNNHIISLVIITTIRILITIAITITTLIIIMKIKYTFLKKII